MKPSPARPVSRVRFQPWQLALCVLLAGWVPSLAVGYLSYTTLGRTLDEKISADARSLAGFLAKLVEDNLVRTGETVDYYRTLPSTAAVLQAASVALATPPPPPPPATSAGYPRPGRAAPAGAAPAGSAAPPSAEDWLGGIYYAQTRVDGLFLADNTGRLLAAVPPPEPALLGRDYASERWKENTAEPAGGGFYVSPAYARPSDGRLITSVVVAIRDRNNTLLGYLGADTLIERMGRRLATTQLTRRGVTATQLVDQNGFALFTPNLAARRPEERAAPPKLLEAIRAQRAGQVEIGESAYFFHPVERAGWTAVLEESAAYVHQPVRDMRSQTLLMVGWLVAGCSLAAYVLAKLYRRQLNAALVTERAQAFNEKILANMPVGIALIDADHGKLLQANESFLEIVRSLGTLPAGRSTAEVSFGDLRLAPVEAMRQALGQGTPFSSVEERLEPGSGRTRYLALSLLRLQDLHGRMVGVLCLVEDRTADITLREELIEANTTKDQFFAQLSHELRTPLSPVITMVAELELLTGDGDAPPAIHNALDVIRRNVELEARLIDDLLDITRIRSGKLQLSRERINVHRVLHLALEITQTDLRAKGLHLDLHLDAPRHHADADPARLQQVFWNLIKNAVKFTPEGRRIVIRTSNPPGEGKAPPAQPPTRDTPAAATAAGRLRVEVSDEGIGIAPEHLAGIFNAFDQGQRGTTRRFGGLGLGLAISKAMVEAHGGTLVASSPGPERGATFTVELDAIAAPEPPPPTEMPVGHGRRISLVAARPPSGAVAAGAAPGRPPGARVLLVDDHHDTCLGMSLLLRRRGHQVTIGHSVAEGLAAADHATFDLLISDLGLPDGSGCDLMRALRGRGGPPGIALSGFGMESDLEKSAAAGFSDHLIKPVDFERLDAAMARLLTAPQPAQTP